MPTNRRQNIPGKTPRPSRNSHRTRSSQHMSSKGSVFKQSTKTSGSTRIGASLGGRTVMSSGKRAGKHSVKAGSKPSVVKPSFSTSGPTFGPKPSFGSDPKTRKGSASSSGYQPNPLKVGGPAPSKLTPEVLLTRRNLLIGAAAVGGIAAIGGGVSLASSALEGNSTEQISYINVPENAVEQQADYTLIENYSDYVQLTGSFSLPYGTLVWADNDTVAACLNPTEQASPLNTVSLLYLSSGNTATVLDAAQGSEEGFEILDARCSENGLVWTESNPYQSRWRVYTASIANGSASNIQQVDEGDFNWLMPSLAAIGNTAFWQVSPNTSGEAANEPAELRAVAFGSSEVQHVYSSKRAFATRVAPATDGVVITPRADSTTVYYQLTKISADTLQPVDQITLPSSMTPEVVGYGSSGFAFGFTSIYNYGGGIANLGTYTPRAAVQAYNYNNLPWFRYSRSPITAPCWCGNWFIVKSTTALSGVHFASKSYFAIDTVSGADTYGEQLVSSGNCSSFVGLSQVTDDANADNNHTLIRVFTPIEGAIGSAF